MRAAILLAAGSSRRFGPANKLLARRGGEPLVRLALAVARAAPVGRVIVVVGAQFERVARELQGPRVTIVRARDHAEGLSASVRAGLGALWPIERAVFLFLGDMPAVPSRLAGRLARQLQPGTDAVRPSWRGRPGHPALVRRPPLEQVAALAGDRGLAPLLRGRVVLVPAPRGAVLDVDHPRTLRAWTR